MECDEFLPPSSEETEGQLLRMPWCMIVRHEHSFFSAELFVKMAQQAWIQIDKCLESEGYMLLIR